MQAHQPRSRLDLFCTFGHSAFIALLGIEDVHAQVPCEQSVVPNPLALDGDFGQSLDFDGDTLAIGMPSVSFSPGYACIYGRIAAGLEFQALLQAPDGKNGDLFAWSTALQGDQLLMGRRSDGTLNTQGSVYAYQRQPSGVWAMTQKIANNKPGIWAFGWALSIDGNRVAITAKSTGLSPRARVYIFELENGLWVEKAEVGPSLDDNDDWFGASVALQGDRLVVGAPQNGTGRAYIFDRQANGAWVEQALLTPPIVNPTGDEYGGAVELDGDTVVVGSIGHDLPVLNNGAAFVYRLGPTGWALEQKLTLENSPIIPYFGYSLELHGDDLFVSAPTDFTQYPSSGFVYRYTRAAGHWNLVGKFEASAPAMGRWFGSKLARNGTELAVSAPALGTTFPGKVHLFALNPSTHLEGSKGQVSTSAGGTQPLQLAACSEHAGDFYFLLGSLSGTAPVLPLGPLDLPLVFDAYTQFTLTSPNSLILPASFGQLDAWGRADTSFRLPPGSAPSFVGQTVHHAFVVLDQTTLALETVSNPAPVLLAP
jgi:hypothetical protein